MPIFPEHVPAARTPLRRRSGTVRRTADHRAHHAHVDVAAAGDDPVRQRGFPARAAVRLADDDLRDIALAGDLAAGSPRRRRRWRERPPRRVCGRDREPRASRSCSGAVSGCVPSTHTASHGQPWRPEARRVQRIRLSEYGRGPHADHQPRVGLPRAAHAARLADVLQIAVHPLGGEAQRQFAQGG